MLKHRRGYLRANATLQPGRLLEQTPLALLMSLVLFGVCCSKVPPEQRAQEQLAKAREYTKQGKINEAIIEYRRAIQTDSKIAVLHSELGKLYVDRQDYINGSRQLATAVQLDPSDKEARLELG